jgi:protein-export membrane protein SecD
MGGIRSGEHGVRRIASTLVIGMVVASLSGCQLIGALLPDGAGQLPGEGTCATYEVVDTGAGPVTPDMIEQTRTIIENRINATGVVDPVVYADDDGLLWIGVPVFGPDSEIAQEIRSLIGTSGVLEFIPVPARYFEATLQDQPLPEGMLDVEPLFNGTEIADARIGQDQTTGEIVVNLELKETGARLFDEHAEEHYGERFAIVLDGIVESAPSINARRFGGQAQISGDFTVEEASNLVTVLKFGSLPVEIREVGFSACDGSASS